MTGTKQPRQARSHETKAGHYCVPQTQIRKQEENEVITDAVAYLNVFSAIWQKNSCMMTSITCVPSTTESVRAETGGKPGDDWELSGANTTVGNQSI